jgi:hypothetical protein
VSAVKPSRSKFAPCGAPSRLVAFVQRSGHPLRVAGVSRCHCCSTGRNSTRPCGQVLIHRLRSHEQTATPADLRSPRAPPDSLTAAAREALSLCASLTFVVRRYRSRDRTGIAASQAPWVSGAALPYAGASIHSCPCRCALDPDPVPRKGSTLLERLRASDPIV